MTSHPVISTQPQPVIIAQPQRGHWQTDLFDCFSDMEVCLCGTFCTICLGCNVAAEMDECFLCGPSTAMRAVYRTKYGIPGSLCSDTLVTFFFSPCSLCQLKRDINRRQELGIF